MQVTDVLLALGAVAIVLIVVFLLLEKADDNY